MHTEKEAFERQCCVQGCGQPSPEYSPAKIQSMRGLVPHFCIGSRCMGWRWAELMTDGPDSYVSEPGPKGFCGRAGYDIPDDIAYRMRKMVET